jgi:hypothetical protein
LQPWHAPANYNQVEKGEQESSIDALDTGLVKTFNGESS